MPWRRLAAGQWECEVCGTVLLFRDERSVRDARTAHDHSAPHVANVAAKAAGAHPPFKDDGRPCGCLSRGCRERRGELEVN